MRKWSLPACRISQQQQIKQQSFAFLSLYEENPSVGGFPLQRTGYTESALAWWRHRGTEHYGTLDPFTSCDQLRLGHTVRRNYSAMPNSKGGVIKPQLKLRIVIISHCFSCPMACLANFCYQKGPLVSELMSQYFSFATFAIFSNSYKHHSPFQYHAIYMLSITAYLQWHLPNVNMIYRISHFLSEMQKNLPTNGALIPPPPPPPTHTHTHIPHPNPNSCPKTRNNEEKII